MLICKGNKKVVARPEGVYKLLLANDLVCLPSFKPQRESAADLGFMANHFGPRSLQGPRAYHNALEVRHG